MWPWLSSCHFALFLALAINHKRISGVKKHDLGTYIDMKVTDEALALFCPRKLHRAVTL